MDNSINNRILEQVLLTLDIPDSAYEKVEKRYKDLGDWLSRGESRCANFKPRVYPQGSFRLGTVVRPLNEHDEYDLDLGCRLQEGISKGKHTQKHLKTLVGADLEDYRVARNIAKKLEEKNRCWRLSYSDELSFHMDAVPSIPEESSGVQRLTEDMVKAGSMRSLAEGVNRFAGAITDIRDPNYDKVSPYWRISNSEGYALWFESRMKLAMPLLEKRAFAHKVSVDELPRQKWKSPLQQAIQLFKRHRDVMFAEDSDGKPISIILTTLAAEAYRGEQDLASAIENILANMGTYVRPQSPRVPNPVNPSEDFADKWASSQHLRLEEKFWLWLEQARADFASISKARNSKFLVEQMQDKFASAATASDLDQKFGFGAAHVLTTPKVHTITETPAKPWRAR